MLCKATEADLEQMVAFRRKTYGGTRQDALDWLCGIVGLDNILILARDPAPGAKPIPAAMISILVSILFLSSYKFFFSIFFIIAKLSLNSGNFRYKIINIIFGIVQQIINRITNKVHPLSLTVVQIP